MSRARPEKALLPPDSGIFRNDVHRSCAIGDRCPVGRRTMVANFLICDLHLDRIKAIAEDAGVAFRVETAA